MNSLEGYNTNGHEYRVSQMDRSNSRRLKWMMNEARKEVEIKEKEKKSNSTLVFDKNISPMLHKNKNVSNDNVRNISFNPANVNKINNMRSNLK